MNDDRTLNVLDDQALAEIGEVVRAHQGQPTQGQRARGMTAQNIPHPSLPLWNISGLGVPAGAVGQIRTMRENQVHYNLEQPEESGIGNFVITLTGIAPNGEGRGYNRVGQEVPLVLVEAVGSVVPAVNDLVSATRGSWYARKSPCGQIQLKEQVSVSNSGIYGFKAVIVGESANLRMFNCTNIEGADGPGVAVRRVVLADGFSLTPDSPGMPALS